MNNLFTELKRRNVFRVGIAYLAMAWLVLQVGVLLADMLTLPDLVMNVVLFFLIVGFPFVLIFAWAYELTPEGLKRAAEVPVDESVTFETGRKLNNTTYIILGAIIAVLLADRFYFQTMIEEEPALEDVGPVADAVPLGERSYDSIAVLPFVNMSDDPAQEYFSDGISEELLNLLAKTKGLRVAARTSSFAFKGQNQDITGIGKQLKVATVLEGSVRKANTKLRVTAQLIDVDTGYHLWSDTYDRELDDVFAIQDEISAAIVGALAVHFGGEIQVAATSNQGDVKAYQEYLKGRQSLLKRTREDIELGAEHFDRALEIDPKFAPAYAGKAETYLLLSDELGAYGDIPEAYAHEFAAPLIELALELDPGLSDAYRVRALIHSNEERHEEALEDYNRALEFKPNSVIALMWRADTQAQLARWQEAIADLERAHLLDPMSLVVTYNLSLFLNMPEDVPRLMDLADRVEAISPPGQEYRHRRIRAQAASIVRDVSEFYRLRLEAFELSGAANDGNSVAYGLFALGEPDRASSFIVPSDPATAAAMAAFGGDIERARTILNGLDRKRREEWRAIFSAALVEMLDGEIEAADEIYTRYFPVMDYSLSGPLFQDDEMWRYVRPYVTVKKARGNMEAVEKALLAYEAYIENCLTIWEGRYCHEHVTFVRMHRGDFEGALQAYEKAVEHWQLNWTVFIDPGWAELVEQDGFAPLRDELIAKTQKERLELGWEPEFDLVQLGERQ